MWMILMTGAWLMMKSFQKTDEIIQKAYCHYQIQLAFPHDPQMDVQMLANPFQQVPVPIQEILECKSHIRGILSPTSWQGQPQCQQHEEKIVSFCLYKLQAYNLSARREKHMKSTYFIQQSKYLKPSERSVVWIKQQISKWYQLRSPIPSITTQYNDTGKSTTAYNF